MTPLLQLPAEIVDRSASFNPTQRERVTLPTLNPLAIQAVICFDILEPGLDCKVQGHTVRFFRQNHLRLRMFQTQQLQNENRKDRWVG